MTETPSPSSGDLPATAWVSVAEAADKSGVGTSTVRQWYRSGRLPTQRADGDRGAFLVPLDAVLALADQADADGDALGAEVIDLNASYWSAQTEAAREEATAAKQELADARSQLQEAQDELGAAHGQLEFLRSQLAESSEDTRRLRDELQAAQADVERLQEAGAHGPSGSEGDADDAGVDTEELVELRAEVGELRSELERTSADLDRTSSELTEARRHLATTETELQKLRDISTAVGSITDNSWLDLPTNSYRSPVRPQGMVAPGDALSGLLADTAPDRASEPEASGDPWVHEREQEPQPAWQEDRGDEAVSAPAPAPVHALGHHDDDLLPQPEKKGRRGRR